MVEKTTDNTVLLEVIKQQTETITALKNTIEQMNTDSKLLREQLDFLTRKLFGKKSEKTSVISGQIVLDELAFGQFDEAEIEARVDEIEPVISQKKTRAGYSREKALANLPEEDRIYSLPPCVRIVVRSRKILYYSNKQR
ncbi:MAG: Snf7 family protein [Acetobacterium woodii]|nr:Snf7 family protein [Acetobacterium woodii]